MGKTRKECTPVHQKPGNTLNVTEFVYIRAERQRSIMGRVLDWESGNTVLELLLGSHSKHPVQGQVLNSSSPLGNAPATRQL